MYHFVKGFIDSVYRKKYFPSKESDTMILGQGFIDIVIVTAGPTCSASPVRIVGQVLHPEEMLQVRAQFGGDKRSGLALPHL